MPDAERQKTSRVLYALLALVTLLPSGCLLAIAGVAAGGAATGYFYCKGRLYRDYPAKLPDVRLATRAALLDMNFLIFSEQDKDGSAFIYTKTTFGKKVRIYLDCVSSPIPAEGVLTRVAIRVATFGDEGVSGRIFDQIAWRLGHPPAVVPPPPSTPPPGPPMPIQPTSFETTEPKLAPSPKAK